ncbi:MAG: PDZ domain-containing protein [Clostridia bacterium]|nr:PDZ domain-containing protein [Clostridia bacterium]
MIDPETVAGYGENAIPLAFGDRITDISSTSITSLDAVQKALNNYSAGDTVQITFFRQNKKYITEIVLAEVGSQSAEN